MANILQKPVYDWQNKGISSNFIQIPRGPADNKINQLEWQFSVS